MKRFVFEFTAIFVAVLLMSANFADAQWRSPTHDVYNAPTGIDVEIDGNLDEWDGVLDSVTGTDGSTFCGVEFENIGAFENNGGNWTGADDHETCFMIVWDADAVYLALSVTDDEHEHADAAAWKGDGAQILVVPTGMREASQTHFRFNVALTDNGDPIVNNELNHGQPVLETENVAMVRDEDAKKTYYEIKFVPANFGLDVTLSEGIEIGLGICVNDGDKDALGQKGWSGWYPHSIVHGKNTEQTGLVILSSNVVTAVEPADKLTTTWGDLKSIR